MFTFTSEQLDAFFRDPVMALYCITGIELDYFQAARLRYYWFVPNKVDSSGWGTGKTLEEWGYAILRAVLIPGNQVGVYYPIFQTGKDTWWKYFSTIRHPVLESQYRPRKHEWKDPGCWRCEFKSGAMISLPAPGFMMDAQSQASRDFNTMIIGEYTQASRRGEGVDELIGRARAPNFNKHHPIWSNHVLLSAHAESPTHPSYVYFKAVRDCVLGKHSATEQHTNATFTACFRDWSDKPYRGSTFRKQFLDEAAIARSQRTLSKDERRRRLDGIWSQDGKGWYPPDVIKSVLRSSILPQCGRLSNEEIFVLGEDTAPGMSHKADECAFKVWRIIEVTNPGPDNPFTVEMEGRFFHVSIVFGHILKNVDAGQLSGFIHALHRVFGFAKIILDPSGGGSWVYKELIKTRQLIYNAWTDVRGLCTREEVNQTERDPIVVFFKRGSELDALWQPRFLQSDEGIVEAAHRTFREGFEGREFAWPQLREFRDRAEFEALPDEMKWAQIHLDIAWKQATAIRVKVDPFGKPLLTARGFYKFESQGVKKKDAIYAGLYGYCGVKLVLKNLASDAADYVDDVVSG